jgi:hypothetical protein
LAENQFAVFLIQDFQSIVTNLSSSATKIQIFIDPIPMVILPILFPLNPAAVSLVLGIFKRQKKNDLKPPKA